MASMALQEKVSQVYTDIKSLVDKWAWECKPEPGYMKTVNAIAIRTRGDLDGLIIAMGLEVPDK